MTQVAGHESVGSESVGSESVDNESVGSESVDSELVSSESVGSGSVVPSESAGREPVSHESVSCGYALSQDKNTEDLKIIKAKLKQENAFKKEMIQMLSADMENVTRSILNTSKSIELYETKKEEYFDIIQQLKTENDSLIARISQIKQNTKSLNSDEESTLLLMDTLLEDYQGLMSDKADLIKRITTLHGVIEKLNSERKEKVPKLKEYNTLLKNAFYELQETENSMDISLKLWQRKSSYRPVT